MKAQERTRRAAKDMRLGLVQLVTWAMAASALFVQGLAWQDQYPGVSLFLFVVGAASMVCCLLVAWALDASTPNEPTAGPQA